MDWKAYDTGKDNEPISEETTFGWTRFGPTCHEESNGNTKASVLFSIKNTQDVQSAIEKLWELESIGIKKVLLLIYTLMTQLVSNGTRYVAKLPWKSDVMKESLTYSKSLSEKLQKPQIKKLSANKENLQAYGNTQAYDNTSGIVETVPEYTRGRKHYIPRHAIITKEAEFTK